MTNVIFSAFCAAACCCGRHRTGLTASGRPPVEGISLAGPRSVPLGTIVLVRIPGLLTNTFSVDDRTAQRFDGKRWDVFIADHRRARQFGLQRGTVTIIKQ